MSRIDREEELALSKTALRIYMHLVESGKPMGPREIARNLGLSPSLVYYHLKRLEELGLVQRLSEGYTVKKIVSIEGFVSIGRRFVPRIFLYAMLFLGILVGEATAIAITRAINIDRILLLAITALSSVILLLEGLHIRKKLRI